MPSPSKLNNFLACNYLHTLNLASEKSILAKPIYNDPVDELIREQGIRHEESYFDELKKKHNQVVQITNGQFGDIEKDLADTLAAMKDGADVIYQGALKYGGWYGIADFIIKVDEPSEKLGMHSYIIADTKLSKDVKSNALIQLCIYAVILEEIQGHLPERIVVVGGDGTEHEFRPHNFTYYVDYCKAVFNEANNNVLEVQLQLLPDPCDHCTICDWRQHCEKKWRNADHLKQVPGVSKKHRKILEQHNISTLEALADLNPDTQIADMPPLMLEKLHLQANIQSRARKQQQPLHEYLKVVPQQGFNMLPEPSEGDIWFDIEGDAHIFGEGLEYLFGWTFMEKGQLDYKAVWAHNKEEEKKALEQFIEAVVTLRKQYPEMHVYHFGHYETTVIKRLSTRYNTMVDEVDDLLRNQVFVDLHRVVKTGLRMSVESYGLKYLEEHYGFTRNANLGDAGSARKKTALLLDHGHQLSPEIIDLVTEYNKEDCHSTYHLHRWLEKLRSAHPEPDSLSRFEKEEQEPTELNERLKAAVELVNKLYEQVPLDEPLSQQQLAIKTLADLILWERRETKALFWEIFRLRDLNLDELWDENKAIGGPFTFLRDDGPIARSRKLVFSFPKQNYRGDGKLNKMIGSDTKVTMLDLDAEQATFTIKVGNNNVQQIKDAMADANGLYEVSDFGKSEHSKRIMDIAQHLIDHDFDLESTDFKLQTNLLLSDQILGNGDALKLENESNLEAAIRLVNALPENGILPIQGPPGTGKTYTASHMIQALVAQGKKVGVTAQSHAVIENLLLGLGDADKAASENLNVVKVEVKGELPQWIQNQNSAQARQNTAANVIGATSWFWCHEENREKVDVLFMDEAGQFGLFDALACCHGARKLVLLGDPSQLDNVIQGVHPENAAVSVLGHWLGSERIMPEHRGLFLNETFRMAPAVNAFISEMFYEDKLKTNGTEQQAIVGSGPFEGAGLRFCPVSHNGNQSKSAEEVLKLQKIVSSLLTNASWTDKEGHTKRLTVADILVVAPYRAQVGLLRKKLPEGIQVGTVDKFQGREAPIVIFSMATSTPEDAPRGMEFLYSANRLNVAISRAKCMAIMVACPDLFRLQCKTPQQMELANNFCRFLELVGNNLNQT